MDIGVTELETLMRVHHRINRLDMGRIYANLHIKESLSADEKLEAALPLLQVLNACGQLRMFWQESTLRELARNGTMHGLEWRVYPGGVLRIAEVHPIHETPWVLHVAKTDWSPDGIELMEAGGEGTFARFMKKQQNAYHSDNWTEASECLNTLAQLASLWSISRWNALLAECRDEDILREWRIAPPQIPTQMLLPAEKAAKLIDHLRDILYPGDDPNTEWNSDTLQEIGHVFYKYGLKPRE